MSQSSGGRGSFDERERRAIRAAVRRLSEVPTLGDPALLIDALSPCVPIAAALLQVINSAAPAAVSGHAIRLPVEVLQSWMGTPDAHVERAFAPVLRSSDGDFWRADDLAPGLRAKIAVLDQLDRHGLGEGAGYKILKRLAPTAGVEHVSLALLTERRRTFPPRTSELLKALGPSVKRALLRLSLPIVGSRPMIAQVMETEGAGYIVVRKNGAIVELNRHAHDLAHLYGALARVPPGRRFMQSFVEQALSQLARGDAWHLRRGSAILEMRGHFLRAAVHHIPENLRLLTMREVDVRAAAPPLVLPPGVELTRRQRDIAALLVRTGLSYEGIGKQLAIRTGTVRALVPKIYRAFGVRSRTNLVAMLEALEEE